MGHRNARMDWTRSTVASPGNFNAEAVFVLPEDPYATVGMIVPTAATSYRQFVLIHIIRTVRTVDPEHLASLAR